MEARQHPPGIIDEVYPKHLQTEPMEPCKRKEILRMLCDEFDERAEYQGWKKGGATYTKHAIEFFIGAHLASAAVGRPLISDMQLALMTVRPHRELLLGEKS